MITTYITPNLINRFKSKNTKSTKLNSNQLKDYILNLGYSDKESTDLADYLDSINKSKYYHFDTPLIEFLDLENLKIYRLSDKEYNKRIKKFNIDNFINKISPELNLELIYINLDDDMFIFKSDILPITDYSDYFKCYYLNNKFIVYDFDYYLDGYYIENNTIKFGVEINNTEDSDKEKHLSNVFKRACILAHNEKFEVQLNSLNKENLELYNKVKDLEQLK